MEEGISEETRSRAQAAKQYIEHRHSMLLQYHLAKEELWQELIQKMRSMRMPLQQQRRLKIRLSREEGSTMRQWRSIAAAEQFREIKIIGKGAFGEVVLCRGPRGEPVALKKINKLLIKKQNKYKQVRDERNLHVLTARSEWLVKLKYCFQDPTNLFLGMQYLPGGDLMGLLMDKQILPHKSAQFYAAEIVMAIHQIHTIGYIHRDVKPDNLLIDARGHLKLTDFGLCRQLKAGRDRIKSAVGTKGYVAPQVCISQQYTQAADFWSLGIIIYQMLIGYPPFTTSSALETIQRTLNYKKTLVFPQQISISNTAKDLICRLITDKETRLTIEEIKIHPFFVGINWDQLDKMRPPFIPSLLSCWDTRYFDQYLALQTSSNNKPALERQAVKDRSFLGYAFNEHQYSNRILERLLIELQKKSQSLKGSMTQNTQTATQELLLGVNMKIKNASSSIFVTPRNSENNFDFTRQQRYEGENEEIQKKKHFINQTQHYKNELSCQNIFKEFSQEQDKYKQTELDINKTIQYVQIKKRRQRETLMKMKQSNKQHKNKKKLALTPQKIRFQSVGQRILMNHFEPEEKEYSPKSKLKLADN